MIIPIEKDAYSEVAEKRAELISLRLLTDLHNASERHLQTSAGMAALASFGIKDRTILRAYRIGYLPGNFRRALTDADRRTLASRTWAGALVFPAFEGDLLVDLCVAQTCVGGHVTLSVWDTPRGQLAPVLATAYQRLALIDHPRRIGSVFQADVPALLLRGGGYAQDTARHLAAGGVTEVDLLVRRGAHTVAAQLRAAGITVHGVETVGKIKPVVEQKPLEFPTELLAQSVSQLLPPSPITAPIAPHESPLTLILIDHDTQRERAIFQYGTAIYEVNVPWNTSTVVNLTCLVGDVRHPNNEIDLAQTAQRRRFALAAHARTGVAAAECETALQLLADAVPALGHASRQSFVAPTVTPTSPTNATILTSAERVRALERLRDPQMLTHLSTDLEKLGWFGDLDAKMMVILGSLSRLADEPLWLSLTSTSAGERFPAIACLAAITPSDQVVHVSRLTDTALFHASPTAFRHRLLLLDDVSALSPAAATALRVLQVRGALSSSHVERDVLSGEMRTRFSNATGPLAVLAAVPSTIPPALQHHLLAIPFDESPEQTARYLAARRSSFAQPQRATRDLLSDPLATAWRQAFSLLTPAPVVIPSADAVVFPPIVARSRLYQDAAFGFIIASTLAHQFQRLRSDGALIATAEDISRGMVIATHLAANRASDLSSSARHLLLTLSTSGRTTFTMDDVTQWLPTASRWEHRTAVDELVRLDYVDAGRGGRGRVRQYTVVTSTASTTAGQVGELAAVGGTIPPTVIPWSQTC